MDIQILRRETEVDHLSVEGVFPAMDDRLDRTRYVACLQQIYGVVAGWEERAAEVAPEWLQPALAARQRKRLLELDLAWFGVTELDDRRPVLPEMADLPSLFGAMYVMEGSTLGGQFIARHTEAVLGLSDGRGNGYFRGHGDRTGQLWREFCEMLKTRIPDEQSDLVVVSAKAMFSVFGAWMREGADNGR